MTKNKPTVYTSDTNGSLLPDKMPTTQGTLYIDSKEQIQGQLFEGLKVIITSGGEAFGCIFTHCDVYVNNGGTVDSCMFKSGSAMHVEDGANVEDIGVIG